MSTSTISTTWLFLGFYIVKIGPLYLVHFHFSLPPPLLRPHHRRLFLHSGLDGRTLSLNKQTSKPTNWQAHPRHDFAFVNKQRWMCSGCGTGRGVRQSVRRRHVGRQLHVALRLPQRRRLPPRRRPLSLPARIPRRQGAAFDRVSPSFPASFLFQNQPPPQIIRPRSLPLWRQ